MLSFYLLLIFIFLLAHNISVVYSHEVDINQVLNNIGTGNNINLDELHRLLQKAGPKGGPKGDPKGGPKDGPKGGPKDGKSKHKHKTSKKTGI